MYDLIILGGGPAGLAAAVYAIRKRLNVLLITRDLGGKTNYRLQLPFVEKHLVITGDGVFKVKTRAGHGFKSKTLLIATGASERLLNVPGEKKYRMRGLCYSAVSYAPLFVERDVVVIGDTALALRSTAELASIARRVSLVAPSRGDLDSPMGRKVLTTPNVEVLEGYDIREVQGDEYARKMLIAKDGATREMEADAFFVEMGLIPQSDIVADLVERDALGRIKVDCQNQTSCEGLFAAGDVTNTLAEHVLIAVGEGAKAALTAYVFLLTKEE